MALDIGEKRIGVAISDPTGIIASPHSIIDQISAEQAINEIREMVGSKEIEKIIIGLPYSLNGSIGQQASKVIAFTQLLKQHVSIPVEFRDERFTTASAVELKPPGRKKKSAAKPRYDAIAAAIILQEYLDENR